MKKLVDFILTLIVGMIVMFILFICLLTPEKTDDGTYTDVIKYWTDKEYVCSNFKCDANK